MRVRLKIREIKLIISPADVTISTVGTDNLTYSELTPSSQDLTIDQKKYFAFKFNDVAQAQANTNIMDAHLENAKKAIEEVQDSFLLGMHAQAAADNIVGSDASPVTLSKSTIYSYFVDLALKLKNADALSGKETASKQVTFTREQIGNMSGAEFSKNEKLIMEHLRKGLIR